MSFDNLANGAMREAMGVLPDEAFWLAIILLVLALALVLLILRSVRDRAVLDMKPVVGATYVLTAISMLSAVGGILILFY